MDAANESGVLVRNKCTKATGSTDWFAFPLSLAVLRISWGRGPAQGIHRYILGAPAVSIALARWCGNPVSDRAWASLSILSMGLPATLFAVNRWVA